MNIALCEWDEEKGYDAGFKARYDALRVAIRKKYKHIVLFHYKKPRLIMLVEALKACTETIFMAGKDDCIFIQYPSYPMVFNWMLLTVLSMGRRIKGYKVRILIHDVPALRHDEKDGEIRQKSLRKEVERIRFADQVIVHNDQMLSMFHKAGWKGRYGILGPFDYLYDEGIPVRDFQKTPYIIIAGNLSRSKSGYVYSLGKVKEVNFRLYGANYEASQIENIDYMGRFEPEDLIKYMDGQFGLVWDGASCETCQGGYGQYLKYNNPHKVSLYLAAGLPIIIWKQAALAQYVQEKEIGICINSLLELESRLQAISETQYIRMLDNVSKIRNEITQGMHLMRILDEQI